MLIYAFSLNIEMDSLISPLHLFFFFNFYLFLQGKGGRKRERETNINVWLIYWSGASQASPTGDPAHNPGMCPDWESNWRPFGSQARTQATLSHTGQGSSLNILFYNHRFADVNPFLDSSINHPWLYGKSLDHFWFQFTITWFSTLAFVFTSEIFRGWLSFSGK